MTIYLNRTTLSVLLTLSIIFAGGTAFGVTVYVDTAGSDSTGTGKAGAPLRSISFALKQAVSGDVIVINPGTYREGQLTVPTGVSLTSAEQNASSVVIQPNADMGSKPFVELASTSPVSRGDQSLTHLTFDGATGSQLASKGILIRNRSKVTISHNIIRQFTGDTDWTYAGSWGIWVESTQIARNVSVRDYWPYDIQAPGMNGNIQKRWPAHPVDQIIISHNQIIDCGDGDEDSLGYAVGLFHLKDSVIHDNTIDCQETGNLGQPIGGGGGAGAFLNNVDVYNNKLWMNSYSWRSAFAIEVWTMYNGCEFYKNRANRGFSLVMGKETQVYDNVIVDKDHVRGIGIEFMAQSHGTVYKNYIEGTDYAGIDGGSAQNHSGFNDWVKGTTIRNNVIYNVKGHGIVIYCKGGRNGKTNENKVSDFYIHNNTVDTNRGKNSALLRIWQQDNTGKAVVSKFFIKNNLLLNGLNYAGQIVGTVSDLTVSHHILFGNAQDSWTGVTAHNNYVTDPAIKKQGDRQDMTNHGYYALAGHSDAIDAGDDVGGKYVGQRPDIGAIEYGDQVQADSGDSGSIAVTPPAELSAPGAPSSVGIAQ